MNFVSNIVENMVSGSESWIKLKPPSVGIRSKLSLLMQSRTHLGGELGANIYLIDGIIVEQRKSLIHFSSFSLVLKPQTKFGISSFPVHIPKCQYQSF